MNKFAVLTVLFIVLVLPLTGCGNGNGANSGNTQGLANDDGEHAKAIYVFQ